MVHSEIYLKTQEIENRPLNRRVEKDKREESNIPMVWRKINSGSRALLRTRVYLKRKVLLLFLIKWRCLLENDAHFFFKFQPGYHNFDKFGHFHTFFKTIKTLLETFRGIVVIDNISPT